MSDRRMRCDELEAVLHDVLDGAAHTWEREAVAAHAAECAACGTLVGDMTALRTAARALPRERPERDLWSGIEPRIVAPVVPLATPGARALRRDWRVRYLAVAALTVSAGAATVAGARSLIDRPETRGSELALDPPAVAPTIAPTASPMFAGMPVRGRGPFAPASRQFAFVSSGDQSLDRDLDALARLFQERRQVIDPATLAIVDRNLRLIDQAIAECRVLLARDPTNAVLARQLRRALESKASVLRTLARLPTDID